MNFCKLKNHNGPLNDHLITIIIQKTISNCKSIFLYAINGNIYLESNFTQNINIYIFHGA